MLNDSYYLFVEVAAQRCSQLMRGAKPKVELRAHKFTTVACAEVKEDLIPWQSATDEQLAEELATAAAEEAAEAAAMAQIPRVMQPLSGDDDNEEE
ncbi:MAG: DNA-directed RNA polymerase subunit omega [Acidobacteriota bacterium]|jgi:DNA-directed RNA polymerase subunit K/omega